MNGQNKKSRVPGLLLRLANWFRKPMERAPALSADRYQPEKHYMRGPGPKTRAKDRVNMRVDPLAQ